eukprot:EG_transcript_268
MPHPHLQVVYPRKQVFSNKKSEWGDPSRLERIHRTLRQKYVLQGPNPSFNQVFKNLDKDYPKTISIRGFNSLLVNSGVVLSEEDVEHLFAFYDAEGHGSLDPYDFLIGLRYNLALDKAEYDRITKVLGRALLKGDRTERDVRGLLQHAGLPATGITESAFVDALRGIVGTSTTTSELLFFFSILSNNDRNASLSLDSMVDAIFVSVRPSAPVINVGDLQERLARIIYDPLSPVGGRVGLNRILSRGDKDFNGAVNRREFECIKSFAAFTDAELDALFNYYDKDSRGLIRFDDLVGSYRLQDWLNVTEQDMLAIDEIAVRHIRHRSPGGPGMQRTYNRYLEQTFEKYDPLHTGYFTLTQFFRALEDLAKGDLRDLEIEILFEHWAKDGRVDWHQFLKVLLGEAAKETQRRRLKQEKLDDKQYAEGLLERMAVALYDRERQAGGARGYLRVERLFERHDTNGSGQLSLGEFRRALRALPSGQPVDADDIDILFHHLDKNGSGTVSYREFIDAMIALQAGWALDKKEAQHVPYPYEELSVLQEAVARGAVRRLLGVQGLLSAFGKYDQDGDGLVDRRAFEAVMRYVCDPCPTEENQSHLFAHYEAGHPGKLAYAQFVNSLDIPRFYSTHEADTQDALQHLATAFLKCTQSGTATTDGQRRLFDKYDRTVKGHLTLSEFLKALRSIGYDGPVLYVEYAYRHFNPKQGLTFDQFTSILRGSASQWQPTTQEELLTRLHRDAYGDDKLGTTSIARLLHRHDTTKAGVVELKGFKAALKAMGSTLTEAETTQLFRYFNPGKNHGAIEIREFVEKLRLSVIEPTDMEQIRRILNILGTSVEFRNKGLGGWITRFEPYDHGRKGTVDFVGFTKAVDVIESNKLSDYEKERLFNYYSHDNLTVDYRQLVNDVLYRPLNRGHELHGDPLRRDPAKHTLEDSLLDEDVPRPPPEVLADRGVLPRLLEALYSPYRDGLGTLRLAAFAKTASKGGRYLRKRDFIAAIRGLAKPDSPIPEYESVALYEQLAEGSLGVDLEAFVERAKHTQSVRLTQPHYNEILSRIHDHLWNSGKRDFLAVRELFKSDVRTDGFMDLHDFTVYMRRIGGGLYTDLELELLFNEFAPDRRAIDLDQFAHAIVPPRRLPISAPAGPSSVEVHAIIETLGAFLYDKHRQPSGTLELLKSIQRADRNRDDLLTRQEFVEAIQSTGATQVVSATQLNVLFDSLSHGKGTAAQASAPELLQLVRRSAAHQKVPLPEFQELLYTVKQHFAHVPTDQASVRIFERADPDKTRLIALGPFTTALYALMNKDSPLTPLQLEAVFDVLDKSNSGKVNYLDLLEAIRGLPARSKAKGHGAERVWDVYRRQDVQPDMVRSPVALRPPPPAELPKSLSPFRPTTRALYVDQPGMKHWHTVSGVPPGAVAGGAPSLPAREAKHARYRGLWVPGNETHTDWEETGSPRPNANPEAVYYEHYIPGAVDGASDASAGSVIPPYLTEAGSLEEWLGVLGLQKYIPLLQANEVDLVSITELREADLQDMGLPIGPRRKILKAAKLMP